MEIVKNNKGSGIFVQIGAGAGDLDPRANNRDGFAEFVKSLPYQRIRQIILVEPNPINISLLQKCYETYPQAKIFQVAITPKHLSHQTLDFFYAEDDGPHFQVASINKQHIIKHYGHSAKISSIQVPTMDLSSFLNETLGHDEIELLALDIEGIDADVILDTDFNEMNVTFLSFEYIHLGNKEKEVTRYLNDCNMVFRGQGVDHNGFDYLYEKR